jgi:hypothetical protein
MNDRPDESDRKPEPPNRAGEPPAAPDGPPRRPERWPVYKVVRSSGGDQDVAATLQESHAREGLDIPTFLRRQVD